MPLTYPINPFVARQLVTAADHMEPIRLNLVDLDARLGPVTTASPAASRLSTLESRTTDGTSGNTALDTRVATVESRTTNATTGNTQLGTRVTTLETRTTDASTGNTALGTRVSTVETRTTDAATGNTALGTRVTSLEAARAGGWWKATDSTQTVPYGSAPTAPTLLYNTAVRTPIGCTYSAGVVTISSGYGGWWTLSGQYDINASSANAHNVTIMLTNSAQNIVYAGDQAYYPSNAYTGNAVGTCTYLAAGDTVKVILYVYNLSASGNYTNSGPGIERTHLRLVRIGA